MASPFPGMDPYIEECGLWAGFHNHLVEKIGEHLAETAPNRYFVDTSERSYLVLMKTEGKDSHLFVPDVSVTTPRNRKKSTRKGSVAVAELPAGVEPVTLRAFIEEEHREAFVEIFETEPEQRLVTCIEVLSPSNKRPSSEGRDLYLRKRQSLLVGHVNLVEIDLLRGGERMPMVDPWPDSPYVLMVARAGKSHRCQAWPTYFQIPPATIQVPLANSDPAIPLNLQPMIEAIYKRFRYEQRIDYAKPLDPPLTDEEAAWFQQQLRARSKSKGR
jgi:hypothetical protein